MSIGYTGHCRLSVHAARRRLDHARAARPDWFGAILGLSDAEPIPEPFGRAIARDFGIDAQSCFRLLVLDKTRFHTCLQPALDFLYAVFGTADLILTWELDHVRPAPAPCPPMRID